MVRRKSNVVDFLFETSALKRTMRTGWQVLGAPNENVAEHIWHVAVIGYLLAKLEKVDASRVVIMLIFHDLPEVRVGDINKLQGHYIKRDEVSALKDQVRDLVFEKEVIKNFEEYSQRKSKESIIAHDADVISLLVRLKELVDKGDKQAVDWFKANKDRLRTKTAKQWAKELWKTDSQSWWQDIKTIIHKNFKKS